MNGSNWILFVVASWALIVTPGPDMLYVISRGVSQGRAAGLLSAVGVTTGLLVHTSFAALGLSALLHTSALLFAVIKYLGAAYLVYLGVRAFLDKETIGVQGSKEPAAMRTIFTQGLLSNVLNPKVALFFLAFLPQFVDSSGRHIPLQMVALGLVFSLFGVLFLIAVGLSSGQIGSWLAARPGLAGKLRWITGGVLVALGVRLAVSRRV